MTATTMHGARGGRARRLGAVFTLALVLASCGGSGPSSTDGQGQAQGQAQDSGLAAPQGLSVSYAPKAYRLQWEPVPGATHYQLLEDIDGDGPAPQAQRGLDLAATEADVAHDVLLYQRLNAAYQVRACNADGCGRLSASLRPDVNRSIGYFKAGNAGRADLFGTAVALSGDGSVLAVGAPQESASARGVFAVPPAGDSNALSSGAVYLFTREAGGWRPLAYLKASDAQAGARFGETLALSPDGLTLAVGAPSQDTGAIDAGAVYVFSRASGAWQEQQVLQVQDGTAGEAFGTGLALSADGKTVAAGAPWRDIASPDFESLTLVDAGEVHVFTHGDAGWSRQTRIVAAADRAHLGASLALSADGSTLAAGAPTESSGATRIDGDQADTSAGGAGAVFVFTRSGNDWVQQAYVKGSRLQAGDAFGTSVALSGSGDVLAVGAPYDDRATAAVGDGGGAPDSGAVYTFVRSGTTWSEQDFLKPLAVGEGDAFGSVVALSQDGAMLAVGAPSEESNARGIQGNATDNSLNWPGATYLLARDDAAGWRQQGYLKASNTHDQMAFGSSLGLSSNGSSLVVGAVGESGPAGGTGSVDAQPLPYSGAVYLY